MERIGLSFPNPMLDRMDIGPRAPVGLALGDPSTQIGLGGLRPTGADVAMGEAQTIFGRALERAPTAPTNPPPMVPYSPSANAFWIGGRLVDANDAMAVSRAQQDIGAPVTPAPSKVATDWQPLSPEMFGSYVEKLRQPRGIGENLMLGTRATAEGLVGGLGRTAEITGIPGISEAGRAVGEFAERTLGQTPAEQSRSQLIQQSSSFGRNLFDAVVQGAPSIVLSGGLGLGGIALGGRLAAGAYAAGAGEAAAALSAARATGNLGQAVSATKAAETALANLNRARTVGAYAGAATAVFPAELEGLYQSARDAKDEQGRPIYDLTDPGTRLEIASGAILSSLFQTAAEGGMAKAFSPALRGVMENASKNVAMRMAQGAVKGGMQEAFAEGIAQTIQDAWFDPEVRKRLNATDIKTLAPYIADAHGSDILVAAGAGGILGGIFGGAGNFQRNLASGESADLAKRDTSQDGMSKALFERPARPILSGDQYELPLTGGRTGVRGEQLALRPEEFSAQSLIGPILREVDSFAPRSIQADIREWYQSPSVLDALSKRPALLSEAEADPLAFYQQYKSGLPYVGVSPDQLELPIPAQLAFQFPSAVRPTAPTAPTALVAPTVDTTGLPLFEQPASFPQAPVETQGPVQPTSFLYGPPEAQGTLFPGVPQQQVPPGMQSLLRGAAAPAPEMSPVEAFRAAGDAGQRVMFPYFWPTPTKAERAAAQDRAGYGVTPESQGPMAPALQRLLRDQAFTRAEAERAAQMEGQPTAAEAAAPAMQAQVAETMPTVFDTEAAVTGTNKLQDDARRRIVNILNALTAEQQTRVLDKLFDNDIDKFYADVRASNASKQADLRKKMAQAAGVDESVFKRVKATRTPQEQANAAQAGQVKQGGVSQRPRDGGQVAGEGVDRNVPTQDQEGGGEAGGGNRPVEDGQEPQEVAAIKAKAQAEWDQFFDDKGVGYAALTPERQAEWDQLVQRGDITQVEADAFAQPTPTPAVEEAAPSRPLAEAAEAAPLSPPKEAAEAAPLSPSKEERVDSTEAVPSSLAKEEEKAPTLSVETPFGAGTVLTEADKAIENNAQQAALKRAQEVFDAADQQAKAAESALKETKRGTPAEFGKLMAAMQAAKKKRQAALQALNAAERQSGRYSLADWNTVTGARNADGTPVRPMPLLRVQQAVSKFLSGLAIRPRVGIYRNQADLKSRNPALYAQAVAAREAGDFDSANAAGYSFGDGNVIIFTDRIANQSHLNFVLAHETLGHFGMRGIMPGPKFDALMTSLYDTNLTLRNAVDVAMDERGLSKAEAVEEYLADYAAVLETSLISKIWNAVKGFLNKVGIKFGDESMRYFLDQSRRYVRQGREGVMFDAAEVASQLQAVENGASGNGRFTLEGLRSDQRKIGDTVHTLLPTNYFDLANNLEGVQAAGLTSLDKLNQFADKFLRMANYTAMNNPAAAAYDLQQTKIGDRRRELQDIYDRRLTALLNDLKAADISMAMVDARLITDMRASKRPPAKAENLFNIAPDGTITPNKAEVDRLFALGTLTKDEFTKGVTETREVDLSDGKMTIITNKFEGRDAALYDKYIAAMRAKTDIELDYAKATLENAFRTGEDIKDGIARLRKSKTMAPEDVKFVDATLKTYRDLQKVGLEKVLGGESISAITEASNRAEDFVAKVNEAILAKGFDTKKTDALREFFAAQPAADAFITQLEAFRTGAAMTDSTKFALQQKIKQIVNSYAAADSAVVAAIDMISGGHVPIIRQGQKEVRVQAFVGNKAVTLAPEYKDTMVYAHFDNIGEAKRTADAINESLAGKTYKVLAYDEARNLVEMDVRLVANSGDVLTTAAADPRFDLNNFLYGLRIAGVQLTPTEQAKLIVTMTASSNPLRRKLQYSQTPGNDRRNGLQALSQHIVRRASAIATRENEAAIQRLLDRDNPNTMELWRGNRSGVIAAKKAVDAAKNPAEREIAQRKLQTALYQYRQTNPTEAARKWDGSEKTAPPPEAVNVSRMNYFYGQVHTANEITMNSRDVLEANFETQKLIGDAKAFTALATMGLNVANGVLNLSGVYTNTMNYLATSNAKTGFGGGFGFGKSLAEITLAFRQVGAKKILSKGFEAAAYFEDLAKNPAGLKEAGLQAHEALFLAQQTRNGVMVPATTSVMLNTALRRSSNPRIQKITDLIMLPFNSTETASRRAAGLAAYRLEYERQRAAGNDADTAAQNASRFAEQAINLTLGNYSNLNRPLAWRQGWPSLLFMFKAWPVTSIQLLANLDRKGQIAMLFSLWCLAGLSGLPMAEDAEDIMDTIAQKLGFTSRGIRVEFASLVDSIFPGMSPLVLRGAVSYALGSNLAPNLSGKFSLGDVIPGTDFLLAGAKTDRILNELAGPVPATVLSSAATAASLLSLPFSDTKTLTDVARESRITILRDAFDAYAYAQNGAIVDKRGYVIAPNATAGDYLFRAMGFYPEAAAKQFEQIKYIQRTSNYQKDVMVAFRERWVKARMVNDTEGMRAVEAAVEDWNAETRGTALELRGFRSKAEKLFREATRSSKERALKAAPKGSRKELETMTDLLVAD